jgi:class 3 adenylate cyclase/tetratricopeptide (TPR) repeat protein
MHCPSCGFENPEGLKFCNECGTPLLVRCPQCGFANQPQAKFCGECGAALSPHAGASSAPPVAPHPHAPLSYTPTYLAEKILTSKTALEGERKQVTVLFADLKGSMELLADRDPEEARAILDPVLEKMMAAVHRYEGTVNQVMGDGIMALFGAPIAHEDHAVRACYAALAMQQLIRRSSEEVRRTHGLTVEIRVGLNSGEVVVRAIGNDLHMDYAAIGQTTHLAARMEQLATAGSILLTAVTLRLAEGFIQVKRLGPMPVKGLAAPVEVCELVGAGPARTRLQVLAARGLTPFVGRQGELAALHQALEQAGAGHGQVVAVIGEPGVGKTRLFHEFTQASRTQGWLLLESRSTSYGQATSYLPHLPETRGTQEQASDLRLALRSALRPLGEFGRILACLREAEALAETLDDPHRPGQVSRCLAEHFRLIGAHDQAIAAAQRALALATAGGDVAVQAMGHQYLGFTYHDRGDYRRAIDCLKQTVAILENVQCHERFGGMFPPAVNSRAYLAACHAELGTFAEGRALGDEGLRIAEVVAQPASRMIASWGMGLMCLRHGDLPGALARLEGAMGLCQEVGLPAHFPRMAAALGAAYTLAGRVVDAVPLLTQAMEQPTATAMAVFQALCRLVLGEAQVLAGRLEEAHALVERALALARAHQERGNEAYALRLLGEIAAQREPAASDQAGDCYREALALADKLGMRPLQAHCHRGLGTLYAKIGWRELAHAELSAAIDLYRAMDMTFWLPEAEAVLAQVEGR